MLKPPQNAERRQFGRRQSGAHGWIKVRGRPPLPCVVRNISEGGALLEVGATEGLPFRFRVVIESEGIDCDCEARHNYGSSVGVEFVRNEQRIEPAVRPSTEDVSAWRGRR